MDEENKQTQKEERPQEENMPAQQENGRQKNEDDTQKKVICAIAYLFGILFFLPLIMYPNDRFARFHANQSLVVLLSAVIGSAVLGLLSWIPAVGIVFSVLLYVFEVLMLVLCILGIVSAAKAEEKELPLLGKIRILR